MKELLKEIGMYALMLVAGFVFAATLAKDKEVRELNAAELLCNERVIDAELKQGEAAEHAYNAGKQTMAEAIIALCNEDGKIKLDGAVPICELVIGQEI